MSSSGLRDMNRNNIKIDSLNIGLRGIPVQTARAAIDGLDSEILAEFAKRRNSLEVKQGKINQIDLHVKGTSAMSAADLRHLIVSNITRSFPQKAKGNGDT